MKAKIVAAALLTLGTLAWTAPAQAKELSEFRVCGAGGCTAVTDPDVLGAIIRGIETQRELVRVSTPTPAPFLRLEYWMKGDLHKGPTFVHYYVPSRNVAAVVTGPTSWTWVRPDAVSDVIRRAAQGVAPFPTPRITSVMIDGKAVRDPASYVRLFGLREKAKSFPDEPDWQQIVIRTPQPGPWSTSAATLEYSKSTNVLWRGNDFVRVPSSTASRIEARRSLSAPASRGSFPWTLLFGGIGGAAVIIPAAIFIRRR
jgi:hypothetical protein